MAKRGINKATILGNLGNDPEVRYMPNGNAVATISIATSETWKDKNTGQQQEKTEWHRVVFFNRLAEIVGEYLTKGAKVYIEGKLTTRKWQDQQGNDRYTTEIVAHDMQMLDARGDQNGQQGGNQYQGQGQQQRNQRQQSQADYSAMPPIPEFEDDIPFFRIPDETLYCL